MSSLHFTNKKTEAQRGEPEIEILVHMIYCRVFSNKGEKGNRLGKGKEASRDVVSVESASIWPQGSSLGTWIILQSWSHSERIAFCTLVLVSHVCGKPYHPQPKGVIISRKKILIGKQLWAISSQHLEPPGFGSTGLVKKIWVGHCSKHQQASYPRILLVDVRAKIFVQVYHTGHQLSAPITH